MTDPLDGTNTGATQVDAAPPPPATPRAWKPPWPLKLVAAWEVVGGVGLAAGVLWLAAQGTPPPLWYEVPAESLVAIAIVGGVSLWRAKPPGFLLSCLLQLLQAVQVFGHPFTFALIVGPSLGLVLPYQGAPTLRADLRGAFSFAPGLDSAPPAPPGIIVNLIAAVALLALLQWKARSGQPWVQPRGSRASWDRAQIIGGYQIGAGALGIFNSVYAISREHAMANLLFSLVVSASGAALVQRARWSDGVAVAVNALQIPVFRTTTWAFILHSGLSYNVAIAWGEGALLRLHIDIGGLVNQLGIRDADGYIGVNLAALALVVLLVNHRLPEVPAVRTSEAPVRDQAHGPRP